MNMLKSTVEFFLIEMMIKSHIVETSKNNAVSALEFLNIE
jgi:hypothetical protein